MSKFVENMVEIARLNLENFELSSHNKQLNEEQTKKIRNNCAKITECFNQIRNMEK